MVVIYACQAELESACSQRWYANEALPAGVDVKTSYAFGSRERVGEIAWMMSSKFEMKQNSSMQTHEAVNPRRLSAVDGSESMRLPLLNLMESKE